MLDAFEQLCICCCLLQFWSYTWKDGIRANHFWKWTCILSNVCLLSFLCIVLSFGCKFKETEVVCTEKRRDRCFIETDCEVNSGKEYELNWWQEYVLTSWKNLLLDEFNEWGVRRRIKKKTEIDFLFPKSMNNTKSKSDTKNKAHVCAVSRPWTFNLPSFCVSSAWRVLATRCGLLC